MSRHPEGQSTEPTFLTKHGGCASSLFYFRYATTLLLSLPFLIFLLPPYFNALILSLNFSQFYLCQLSSLSLGCASSTIYSQLYEECNAVCPPSSFVDQNSELTPYMCFPFYRALSVRQRIACRIASTLIPVDRDSKNNASKNGNKNIPIFIISYK